VVQGQPVEQRHLVAHVGLLPLWLAHNLLLQLRASGAQRRLGRRRGGCGSIVKGVQCGAGAGAVGTHLGGRVAWAPTLLLT
jgi:hypothetical protein